MRETFGHYVHAGALSRDADALAELFTEDGVSEAPLVPDGHVFPNRLVGRDAPGRGSISSRRRGRSRCSGRRWRDSGRCQR